MTAETRPQLSLGQIAGYFARLGTIRVRWVGHQLWAEADVVADCQRNLQEAHDIAERCRHQLFTLCRASPGSPCTSILATTKGATTTKWYRIMTSD